MAGFFFAQYVAGPLLSRGNLRSRGESGSYLNNHSVTRRLLLAGEDGGKERNGVSKWDRNKDRGKERRGIVGKRERIKDVRRGASEQPDRAGVAPILLRDVRVTEHPETTPSD